VYYLAADEEGLVVTGGQMAVQTWRSIVGMSGGAAITASPWYWGTFRETWRNAEVMTPPAVGIARMLGYGTESDWNGLVGQVRRDWGDSTVAVVWNVGKKELARPRLNLAAAGMDPNKRYAVWSFWDNQFLGIVKGAWTTPMLAESASQHLCFTDLDRTPNQPVLIGSNLHIWCGAAEIKRVTCTRGAMRIDLTDAGARDGDLWVYSRWPLAFKAASGCALNDVASAGDNVWRISLVGRQHGQPQRVDLEIRLPLTRQVWFWLLVALVVASLVFAAWRYVVGLRVQREHALAVERARIAQDLHDDLGAELSGIAMLSNLTRHHAAGNEAVGDRLREISNHARDSVRRLEEIVWALNPANDSIERFADYFCKFAQTYLELAGVSSRFDLPDCLPARPLNSVWRHNLYLAAKEALHNAVRHGRPATVTIRIMLRDERLVVTIEDDGTGFSDTPDLSAARGSGNMRARMDRIGGMLGRRGIPGHGTVVVFSMPLQGGGA